MPCRRPSSPRSAGPTPTAARPRSRRGCTASSSTRAWTGCAASSGSRCGARATSASSTCPTGTTATPRSRPVSTSMPRWRRSRRASAWPWCSSTCTACRSPRRPQVLGVAEGTVKSRCFRGREALAGDPRRGRPARRGDDGTAGGAVTSHPRPAARAPHPTHPPPTPRGHVPEDLVTESHDDRTPVEHDPTGMRALLSSLPDPGPDARAPRRPDHRGPRGRGGCRRRSSRRRRATGIRPGRRCRARARRPAARRAAGSGCGTSGSRRPSSGPWASPGSSSRARATASPPRSAPPRDSRGVGARTRRATPAATPAAVRRRRGAATSPVVPPAGSGEVARRHVGSAYAASALPDGVDLLVAGHGRAAAPPGCRGPRHRSDRHPGRGPHVRRRARASRRMPASSSTWPTVDGRPAAVLVVDAGAGHEAYAVERSCTTGTAGLISGPVSRRLTPPRPGPWRVPRRGALGPGTPRP